MKLYKDSLRKVQEIQERMNYLSDSGEFHDVETNYSKTISHIPSQQARIPSPRSMLSCDIRLQPQTWNPSGLQANVFANPCSTFESTQTPCQGTHPFMTSSAAGEAPALISTGRLVAREDERIGSTIKMPIFARRPPTISSFVPVDIPQGSWLGSKDSRHRNLNLTNSLLHHHFCWKIRFRNQVTTCSYCGSIFVVRIFPSDVVDRRCGDG